MAWRQPWGNPRYHIEKPLPKKLKEKGRLDALLDALEKAAIVSATDIKGNMTKKFEGGRNIWAPEKEIFKLPNLFDGVKDTLDLVKQNKVTFLEKQYKISKF